MENAKILESLNVNTITFIPSLDSLQSNYRCDIYRDNNGKIIQIKKYYSDGIIDVEKEFLEDSFFNYSIIPFNRISNATFLLECENTENFYQFRRIMIKDFCFDSNKLPNEKELQSYEIPKQLIKK